MNEPLKSEEEIVRERRLAMVAMLQAEETLVSLIQEFGDIARVEGRRERRDRAESLVLKCAEMYRGHENAVLKGFDKDKKIVVAFLDETNQPELDILRVIAALLGVSADD